MNPTAASAYRSVPPATVYADHRQSWSSWSTWKAKPWWEQRRGQWIEYGHSDTRDTTPRDDPSQSEEIPLASLSNEDDYWAKQVRWALDHPSRIRAGCEFQDHEKPVLNVNVNRQKQTDFVNTCRSMVPDIPSYSLNALTKALAASDAFEAIDLLRIKAMDLPHVDGFAVPDLPRFREKSPFGGSVMYTWGLLHGCGIKAAQLIIAEGQLRPADWKYNSNLARSHMPSFGAFGLGRQLGRDCTTIDGSSLTELYNGALKKGKGQQELLIGAIFKGNCEHTALKAGGNESAQHLVASKGAVTTSEKYLITHSAHTTIRLISAAWTVLGEYPTDASSQPSRHDEPSEDDTKSTRLQSYQSFDADRHFAPNWDPY